MDIFRGMYACNNNIKHRIRTSCLLIAAALVPAWTLLAFHIGLFRSLFYNTAVGIVLFVIVDFLLNYDKDIPFLVACRIYIRWRRIYFTGYYFRWKLNKDTENIKKCQTKVLHEILKHNSDTLYYQDAKLEKVYSREDYVRVHPLVNYDHFRAYFDRMLENGEEKVLTSDSPLFYCETSGTTGKPSKIPMVKYQQEKWRMFSAAHTNAVTDEIPEARNLQKCMRVYYNVVRLLDKSANGTRIGPISAAVTGKEPHEIYTTPPAGYTIPHEESTRYIHLLFGLRYRPLKKIETIFVSLAYFAFVELEKEWKKLVDDIRYGTLKQDLTITPETRKLLLMPLVPDPERADELQREFSKGFKNIAKRIWPDLKVIECITSGPFVHYAEALRHQYIGDIITYSPLYGASEGLFGINFWPQRQPANYCLTPWGVFFEFIPLNSVMETDPTTYFMDQVKKGEMYEIVVTTPAGLYRYRLGDIIKIVDFYNECPVFEFQYRSGQLLNIKAEKVSEVVLLHTIKEVISTMDTRIEGVVDFTACESLVIDSAEIPDAEPKASTPYYVVFLEISAKGNADLRIIQHEFAQKLDESLMKNHSDYHLYRKKGAIDPLHLHFVKPGAFQRLRRHMLDTSATSPSQLKLPRVLRKPELLRFMWNERI